MNGFSKFSSLLFSSLCFSRPLLFIQRPPTEPEATAAPLDHSRVPQGAVASTMGKADLRLPVKRFR